MSAIMAQAPMENEMFAELRAVMSRNEACMLAIHVGESRITQSGFRINYQTQSDKLVLFSFQYEPQRIRNWHFQKLVVHQLKYRDVSVQMRFRTAEGDVIVSADRATTPAALSSAYHMCQAGEVVCKLPKQQLKTAAGRIWRNELLAVTDPLTAAMAVWSASLDCCLSLRPGSHKKTQTVVDQILDYWQVALVR